MSLAAGALRRALKRPARVQTPSIWMALQVLLLAAGVVLVALLFLRPALGLDLLWNGLIPLAPALMVVAPGLWRNLCPMASFALLPARLGLSRRRPLPPRAAARLAALGLAALALIVPLRHLSLNTDGPASALMLVASALLAFALGLAYEGRSAWCNALCPIHPAERLYGQSPALAPANARCGECSKCSRPCPDSTRAMTPLVTGPSRLERAVGHIMAGGFAGFVWGWFRIPDWTGAVGTELLLAAYAWPLGGAALSLALYGAALRFLCRSPASRRRLLRLCAAAAVSIYYWYRIPALAGFGPHPGSGMLIDLGGDWPWLPGLSRLSSTSFFLWFLLLRRESGVSWLGRPAAAQGGER